MSNKPINVGLASFGMSGRVFHAPFIENNTNFRLKLILERSKSESMKLYPHAKIVRTFNELLEGDEVELIIINTPTYLHYEMTKAALEAGKHVIVEKPFTVTIKEGEELISLAKGKDLLLTVYHNRRLDGGSKTLKTLVQDNKLGALSKVRITLHRYRPEIGPKKWKEENYPGSGILYDLGSHLIDQCLDLFGWPNDVEADLQIQRQGGMAIDYFKIDFMYDGFSVEIISDMLTKEKIPTYEVEGEYGSFIKFGQDPQEKQLIDGLQDWGRLGVDSEENYGLLDLKTEDPPFSVKTEKGDYGEFFQNVFQALRLKEPLLVKPEEALDVIKIIEWSQKKNEKKS